MVVLRFLTQDQLADVRRQAVLQRLGGEDPSHVVGSEGKRSAGAGREAGRHRGVLDAPFYVVAAEWPVLRAGAALEQQRRRRVPHALERIVGRDQGYGAGALAADPRDDDGQDLAELRRDNQHALDIGFRRRDVQERDQPGTGQLVADEAVMREFDELLGAGIFSAGHLLRRKLISVFAQLRG
jgi:hypothetical protein